MGIRVVDSAGFSIELKQDSEVGPSLGRSSLEQSGFQVLEADESSDVTVEKVRIGILISVNLSDPSRKEGGT